MGILDFLTKSAPPVETKGELTDPTSESWEALLGGFGGSTSGVPVTATSAMRVPAVNAAVSLVAGTVGLLPCKLYRREGDGKAPDSDHAAYALAHDDANEWQSAGKVRELITTDALLHGDGFGYVNKIGDRPAEIIHLPREKVTVEYLDTGEPRYRIGTS